MVNIMSDNDLDVVGEWTEVKLNILRDYASAYVTILKKQTSIRHVAYIDAFAGAGEHISKATKEKIEGSPAIALGLNFDHFHFIDLSGSKTERLKTMSAAAGKANVSIYQGDCNTVLIDKVFPTCLWMNRCRALCLLDPYKINLSWSVVKKAGETKSIEVFINFMIMDANMNALKKDPSKVSLEQAKRMTEFWGDETWRDIAYEDGLFAEYKDKVSNERIIEAYRKRLKEVAGFKYVPDPIPMRNSMGSTVYYLFFASPNDTGAKIVEQVFDKHMKGGQ